VPRTPQKLLADSQSAMNNLSSEHVVMTMVMKSDKQKSGSNAGTQNGPTNMNMNLNVKYEGDIKKHDQYSLKFKEDVQVLTFDQQQNLSEVISGDKLYVQNKLGKWFVIANGANDAKALVETSTFADASMTGNITDKGLDTVNGKKLRHITSTINSSTAAQFAQGIGSSGIQGSKVSNMMLDVWIDETTNYVYRELITYTMSGTVSGLTFNLDTTMQLDVSNFNRPVTITIPANAIPATSLSQVEQS
jgi:hypothetical protein